MPDNVCSIDNQVNYSRYIDTCSEENYAAEMQEGQEPADPKADRAAARERYDAVAGGDDTQDSANTAMDSAEQFLMKHGNEVSSELLWHSTALAAGAATGGIGLVGVYSAYLATHASSHQDEGAAAIMTGATMLHP